jgi:GNAT superfamily N-acetyltransferase
MHHRPLDGELPPIVSSDGYRCEIVTSAAAAAAWSDALLAAWGVPVGAAAGALALLLPLVQNPAFVCFAAIEQASGQIVGGAMLFATGGVAGLYADGVRPEHRQHDLHDALIAIRLAEARRRGCDIAFSQTLANHPAQHNMAQAGFTVAYERPNYVLAK